jgi:hypothetical protein
MTQLLPSFRGYSRHSWDDSCTVYSFRFQENLMEQKTSTGENPEQVIATTIIFTKEIYKP